MPMVSEINDLLYSGCRTIREDNAAADRSGSQKPRTRGGGQTFSRYNRKAKIRGWNRNNHLPDVISQTTNLGLFFFFWLSSDMCSRKPKTQRYRRNIRSYVRCFVFLIKRTTTDLIYEHFTRTKILLLTLSLRCLESMVTARLPGDSIQYCHFITILSIIYELICLRSYFQCWTRTIFLAYFF